MAFHVHPEFRPRRGPPGTYLSQLELLIVFVSLAAMAKYFKGFRCMAFVVNALALVSLVWGGSSVEALDGMARQRIWPAIRLGYPATARTPSRR